MSGFKSVSMPTWSTCHTRIRRGLSGGLAAIGILGATLPAAAASKLPSPPSASLPPDAISLNLGDLIRSTIRFVQVANISDQQEVEIGQEINDMLLRQQYQLYPNRRINQYVEQIGQRLVANSDRRDIPYKFQVVVSDNINAFAVPGGYIYVTTGLLRAAENEAQLASVLAHEIAHVNERHSVQALRQAVLAQGIAETAGLDTSTLARIGYQLAVNLPRSREAEYEADRVGLNILQNAGYAPIAFANFLEQLQDRGFAPEFLRTHPTSANRIEEVREQIGSLQTASTGQGLNEDAYQRNVSPLL